MEGRKKKKHEKNPKSPTQPLCRSVSGYNQPRSSLSCSLHFVLFSSLLIRFGFLHTVSSSSRAPDPLPAPRHPRCGLNGREATPKAPRRRRRLSRRWLLAKSGRPEAASNSSQLLRIRWAKQHASCASLLGAEPVSGGGVGGSAELAAAGRGPRAPCAPGPAPSAGCEGLSPAPTPRAGDSLRGGKGCADAGGHAGGSENAGAGAGLVQVLRPERASSRRGQPWARLDPSYLAPTPTLPLLCQCLDPYLAKGLESEGAGV